MTGAEHSVYLDVRGAADLHCGAALGLDGSFWVAVGLHLQEYSPRSRERLVRERFRNHHRSAGLSAQRVHLVETYLVCRA